MSFSHRFELQASPTFTKAGGFLTGLFLIVLNVSGRFQDVVVPFDSERTSSVGIFGFDQTVRDADDLFQLLNMSSDQGKIHLDDVTMAVCLSSRHSNSRRIGVAENWLLWSLGWIYSPATRTQNTTRLISGGAANCSERCQILKTISERSGFLCRFIGLNGHVVLEVQTTAGWQVADPDFGVTYPLDLAGLQTEYGKSLMQQSLHERGFSDKMIHDYVGWVQSTADNVTLPIGSPMSPRLWTIEVLADWLIWIIPAAFLVWNVPSLRTDRRPMRQPDLDESFNGVLAMS